MPRLTFLLATSMLCLTLPAQARAATCAGVDLACPLPGKFFADPDSNAAKWVRTHATDARQPLIQANLATRAAAIWIGGWYTDVKTTVSRKVEAAATQGEVPILVAYNIPHRDCGQYSAGGAASAATYKAWIRDFVAGVGEHPAVVILEPDALAQLDCLSAAEQAERLAMLNDATSEFYENAPQAWVYLDAGHSGWLPPTEASKRLEAAGVAQARGFSLNVSNFITTGANNAYGQLIQARLKAGGLDKAFVIDTSRNGNGPLGKEWCDPAGRKIGVDSALTGTQDGAEATLWIKAPGNADGCAGRAGEFIPNLAVHLIEGN